MSTNEPGDVTPCPCTRHLFRAPALLAVSLLAAACGDPTEPPAEPSELRIESGDQQDGTVAETLPRPLVVRVVDAAGSPVVGVDVSWQVTSGGGSLDVSTTSTGADGLAENRWSLGTVAAEQRATAGVTGLANVEFRATATPGPPHTILVSPERDTLLVNEARILDASVTDAHGNLIDLSELELVWSSDEPAVATVNEEGVMRALAPGVARVALTAGEAGVTVQVTVVQIESLPIPTRSVSGAVSLPVTSNAETDYVHTLWGGAAPVASDGTFTVEAAAEQASTISVLRGDRLLGLQILSPGESPGNVPLDPVETAVGLLYQNPILSSVPPQVTGELLGLLRDQPETDELAGAIGRHLETHGYLLMGEDEGLLDAYREATAAAIARLLAMGEGEVMSANAAPGGDQLIPGGAGIWITAPPRDELEPEVPLKIENNLQRWVSVWEAPTEGVAPRGPASRNVFLPAADFIPDLLSVDGLTRWAGILWKLVSGDEYSPSEPVFTSVEFTHEQPRLVLMAYGPGLQSFRDDWADHLDASDKARLVNPYLATLFFEFVLPFTDLINTVELSSLDALRGMAEEIVEDLQAFVLAGDVLDCLARGAAGEVQVVQTLECVAALLVTKCLKDDSCLTRVLEHAQGAVGDGQLVSFKRVVELKVRTLCPKCEAAVQFESFVSNSEHMFFSWKALEQARLRHDAVLSYNELLGARELRIVEPEVRKDQRLLRDETFVTCPPAVQVLDENQTPVAGAWVRWQPVGGGTVAGESTTVTVTDSEGQAEVDWAPGSDPDADVELLARLAGDQAQVTFTLCVTGGGLVCPDQPTFTPHDVPPEVTNPEEVANAIADLYPDHLEEVGIGGTVLLHLFIDEEGTTQVSHLAESSGYRALDCAALRVSWVFEFAPALHAGQRVPVWIQMPISFGSPG